MNDRTFLAALPDEAVAILVAYLIEVECPGFLGLKNHPECEPNLSKITCRACWERALAMRGEEEGR
jgi:hypothetical protein